MRRNAVLFICILLLVLGISCPSSAQEKTYRIEVLQVTDVISFQMAYDGFLKELEKNGIVLGKNLNVKRTIIDFDIRHPSLWKKMKALVRIRSEASRIAGEKPDLVLTVGTPVTRYAKDKLIKAGIPVVFTAAAFPIEAGCRSMTEAGPGFTGATSFMDMSEAVRIVRLAFPAIKRVGIVHSDDGGIVSHLEEAEKEGKAHGFTILTEQADIEDPITPHLQDLQAKGVEAFAVPPDPYYIVRNYEVAGELGSFSKNTHIPILSLVIVRFPGALLYVGTDFELIGGFSGRQAVKILKHGVKPESLPVLRQQDLTVLVDMKLAHAYGLKLSPEILRIARPIE